MNKTLKWIIISLVVLIVLLLVLKKTGVIGKDQGIKVTAEKAVKRTIVETVNASGKIYPEIEVKMSPDISGEIVKLNVAEGDSVKKGQVLAQIYGDIYATQRDQAAAIVNQQQAQLANTTAAIGAMQAQLDQAKKTYDMQKQLYDEKVISANEFNTADAAYKSALANFNAAKQGINASSAGVASAKAALAKANKDISLATLVSPMDGVVDLLNVKKGERVVGSSMMAGTEMMRIADLSKIEIRVDVGENDIPKVHLGDSAVIEVDAYNDRKFNGIVTQIAASNNGAATQTASSSSSTTDVTNYKVYIRLSPDSYKDLIDPSRPKSFPFRPGMSASADIQTKTKTNVLSIPINAVTTREKNDSTGNGKTQMASNTNANPADVANTDAASNDLDEVVFILQPDGTVKKQIVKTGIQDINNIEVTDGLKEGDEVITGPYDVVSKTLKPNDKVKVVPKSELFNTKK
ncbi:HlyD family efflux transporter periplasmic adaptor subunit [Ginsengibacter hankyongi]|uniref:HlyD family efflux transporter periplasmic adaptor subunit n=1 Tax=Ginsengibacter hankyongi TaxID=2607284 RepID=A0A5J5IKA9_9BACT|nr:efflux RND transporter periplasmic adaptor subunit [Ginsengibacter hankyongi]KAA9039449.1 HlyD family efflux transporter periplasmic adaptor subunit [Ginsengibacter hankyongi]